MTHVKDITGVKRDKLVAVNSSGIKCRNGDYIWNFVCECGNPRQMSIGMFRSKSRLACKSCAKDRVVSNKTTHGFKQTHKTYKTWLKIRERCYNQNSVDYPNYGGKGIKLDDKFKDFLVFYNELGEAPDSSYSVDRIDYSKNYEPGNIRWATDMQQARNKGKMKNNTSGVNGINWENKIHPNKIDSTTYAVAQWKEYNENIQVKCKKSFSVKKFGLLEAFFLACQYRENKITELNSIGYGYSDKHGK